MFGEHVDPWIDIDALESETQHLLTLVSPNQKKGSRTQHQQPRDDGAAATAAARQPRRGQKRPKDEASTPTPTKLRASKKRTTRTPMQSTALLALSPSTMDGTVGGGGGGGMDQTRNLYSAGSAVRSGLGSGGGNRVTVEVLDDAGEDATPRDDADLKREKLRNQLFAAEQEQFRQLRSSEEGYRTYQFTQEKTRVAKRDDTFVPAPTVRISDVNRERARLDHLEESARRKAQHTRTEAETRREFLQQDVSASKIQALFRGSIGRQKAQLVRRLHDIDEGGVDWVEVRDRESGDTWFYNKRTGVSQWERPDEMDGQLAKGSTLKRLPPFSPSPVRAARSGSSGGLGVMGAGETMGSADRVRTAPANAMRAFTAATTLPSLDSLSRAKTAAVGDKSSAAKRLERRVSFNTTIEVNTGTETMALHMAMVGGAPAAPIRRVETPAKSERTSVSPLRSPLRSALSSPGGSVVGTTPATPGTPGMLNTGRSDATEILSWNDGEAQQRERTARAEVDRVMGLDKTFPPANLLDPGGSFKPHLRTTVLDSLLTTRFDSVAHVMSDMDWTNVNEDPFQALTRSGSLSRPSSVLSETSPKLEKIDPSRRPMVSLMHRKTKAAALARSPLHSRGRIDIDPRADPLSPAAASPSTRRMRTPLESVQDASDLLSIREVDHREAAMELGATKPNTADGTGARAGTNTPMGVMGLEEEMCFGCWSAGGTRKCQLHEAPYAKRKPSETMLLCKNWELSIMRRRYRAEEIQELFERKKASLRYISKAKKFLSVVEQKHQIYRITNYAIDRSNFRFNTFTKSKRWLYSFADELRAGRVRPRATKALAKRIRDKRTLKAKTEVRNYWKIVQHQLPLAPVTGYSWPERTGEVQYLFTHPDAVLEADVEIIFAEPVPVPAFLYQPRKYYLPPPITIPMPQPEYADDDDRGAENNPLDVARHIDVNSPAAWLERVCSAWASGTIEAACTQVKAVTPAKGSELLRRSKDPPPSGVYFATLGRKPTPGNLAVGGLPMELLTYQMITTFVPSQFGALMVMDKNAISPGVSPETAIKFETLAMLPGTQAFVLRVVEHPLNYRRAPTIILNSQIRPDDKRYYGQNRPEQTGEEEAHGFRTGAWCPSLLPGDAVIPFSFVPGLEVATFNTPKPNVANTTHADLTYPFCTPSTRDTTTLDFYHLLLNVTFSANKAQIFTVLSTQECGKFMAKYDATQPLGPLMAAVYRSWAFVQKDPIQEFKTDDGIPYWYHRVTGQTFWERPLYEDELVHPLKGGTILDGTHDEEPTVIKRGQEGTERRMNQGDFRKVQGNHHESDVEAAKRRKRVAALAPLARDRNEIPGVKPMSLNPQMSMFETVDGDDRIGGVPTDAASTLGTLSEYTMETADSPNPRKLLEIDVSRPSAGLLHFPHAQVGTPNINDEPLPGAAGGFIIGRPPVVHGTLHNFTPEGDPTTWEGGRIQRGNMAAGHIVPTPPASPLNRRRSGFGSQKTSPTSSDGGGRLSPGTLPSPTMGTVDPRMVDTITQSLGQALSTMHIGDGATPQDMIQIGLGLGMALMQSMGKTDRRGSAAAGDGEHQSHARVVAPRKSIAPAASAEVENASMFPAVSETEYAAAYEQNVANAVPPHRPTYTSGLTAEATVKFEEPVNKSRATVAFNPNEGVNHASEEKQNERSRAEAARKLTALEAARQESIAPVMPTDGPDFKFRGGGYAVKPLPLNADEGAREDIPVLVYPELSSVGGQLEGYKTHPTAGLGDTFGPGVNPKADIEGLKFMSLPLPKSFFEAIVTTHVATQEVDYLPQALNLPTARNVGRVKPRSAAADWLAIQFDPWSAGKSPLNVEYVASLSSKEHEFQGTASKGKPTTHVADGSKPDKGKDKKDLQMRESIQSMQQRITKDAFINVEDDEGLAKVVAAVSIDKIMEEEFKKLASLCRHSKFSEAEDLLNQPDWRLPIDYQDSQGNSILHIVAQNGSKRLAKLCLKRGASINLQNIYGNTCLHFAYGMGYHEWGDYMVSKGADETIKNAEGLSCFEGVDKRELSLL